MWQVKSHSNCRGQKCNHWSLYNLDEYTLASGEKYEKMRFFTVTSLHLEMLIAILSLKTNKQKKKPGAEGDISRQTVLAQIRYPFSHCGV